MRKIPRWSLVGPTLQARGGLILMASISSLFLYEDRKFKISGGSILCNISPFSYSALLSNLSWFHSNGLAFLQNEDRREVQAREDIQTKKTFQFGHCPNFLDTFFFTKLKSRKTSWRPDKVSKIARIGFGGGGNSGNARIDFFLLDVFPRSVP